MQRSFPSERAGTVLLADMGRFHARGYSCPSALLVLAFWVSRARPKRRARESPFLYPKNSLSIRFSGIAHVNGKKGRRFLRHAVD